jgi:hypothetical protein
MEDNVVGLLTLTKKAFHVLALVAAPFLAKADTPDYVLEQFGPPPAVTTGPLSDVLTKAVRTAFAESVAPLGSETQIIWGAEQEDAIEIIAASGDPRLAWLIGDLMRFVWQRDIEERLVSAAEQLLGKQWAEGDPWNQIIDHLIVWDIPEPPEYLKTKRVIYTTLVHGWDRLFVEGDVDWRLVTWGGVPIDARPFDQTDLPCPCIPAVDNPTVTSAEEASWLRDNDIVFGIVVNGEARAYPRQIMEVREMVNDTLGGRHLGIPYCSLCGAAQAYFTDNQPDDVARLVLRTSGLLFRSNKVMFDLNTYSIFDTFTGEALTGPLAKRALTLEQVSVITSDWKRWREAYPHTTVLTENLALGRNFNFREGRDVDGPIFPVGDVDPRLPVQEEVVGVIAPNGTPVAFPRGTALLALRSGKEVAAEGIILQESAGGLRAVDKNGTEISSHQAYWFAWSQFHSTTEVWSG